MKNRIDTYVDAATVAQDPTTANTWRGHLARALINKINDNMMISKKGARQEAKRQIAGAARADTKAAS